MSRNFVLFSWSFKNWSCLGQGKWATAEFLIVLTGLGRTSLPHQTVFIHSFIHSVFCLTTGPKPHLKRFVHIVRSRASSFKWEYPLLSLRSSSSFLRLLPCLLVTSFSPFIFPSITCFRRQFLRKMWPIQLAFRFLISCSIIEKFCVFIVTQLRPQKGSF